MRVDLLVPDHGTVRLAEVLAVVAFDDEDAAPSAAMSGLDDKARIVFRHAHEVFRLILITDRADQSRSRHTDFQRKLFRDQFVVNHRIILPLVVGGDIIMVAPVHAEHSGVPQCRGGGKIIQKRSEHGVTSDLNLFSSVRRYPV